MSSTAAECVDGSRIRTATAQVAISAMATGRTRRSKPPADEATDPVVTLVRIRICLTLVLVPPQNERH